MPPSGRNPKVGAQERRSYFCPTFVLWPCDRSALSSLGAVENTRGRAIIQAYSSRPQPTPEKVQRGLITQREHRSVWPAVGLPRRP